ncbi:hypothetical protein EUTSA_v10015497mg, partial [Eutrema salsugineum]
PPPSVGLTPSARTSHLPSSSSWLLRFLPILFLPMGKHRHRLQPPISGSMRLSRVAIAAAVAAQNKSLAAAGSSLPTAPSALTPPPSEVSESEPQIPPSVLVLSADPSSVVSQPSESQVLDAPPTVEVLISGPGSITTEISAGCLPGETPVATVAAPPRNSSELFKESSLLDEIGTPSEHVSGVPFVLIPDENVESAKEEFKDFIFARFHGDAPEMGRIIGVVNAIWARSGPRIFVHNIGQGSYLLKVINPRVKEVVLSRSMWHIAGYPMFVAPWSSDFDPEQPPLTSAVVPVEQSLARIATAVGKPVSLAPETERKDNFHVAKVYVRVDLRKELPKKILSGFSNGKEVEIAVSYPWLPSKCASCGKLGHDRNKCRSRFSLPTTDRESNRRSLSSARSSVQRERPRVRRSRPGRSRNRRLKKRLLSDHSASTDGKSDKEGGVEKMYTSSDVLT